MKKTDLFYKTLPVFCDFRESTELKNYHQMPANWWIVLTDVVGSTQAIEAGHYKEVNIISVLAITTLFNLIPKEIEIPFLFGGDGVTFFLPESLLPHAKKMVEINQQFAKEVFNLELRGHFLALREMYAAGYTLQIAKQRVSKRYNQAYIIGNGIDFAEKRMKSERLISKSSPEVLSFSPKWFEGFACSFQDIHPNKEEVISLIVKARKETMTEQLDCYHDILIYLDKNINLLENSHPLQYEQLQISQETRTLLLSEKVKTWKRSNSFRKWLHWVLPFRQKMVGFFLKWFPKIPKNPRYETWIASDYRKIDGALKMTITCYQQDRLKLEAFLDSAFQKKKIFYGLHINSKAFITCSVRQDNEVHLIDGADGGYAFAAKHLKQQLIVATE